MKGYKKSRASYPNGVLAIYDNNGKTADRYTVVYEPFELDSEQWFPITAMSGKPFHPQGICLHNEYRHRPQRMSGERVINIDELPDDCQQAIRQDLAKTLFLQQMQINPRQTAEIARTEPLQPSRCP